MFFVGVNELQGVDSGSWVTAILQHPGKTLNHNYSLSTQEHTILTVALVSELLVSVRLIPSHSICSSCSYKLVYSFLFQCMSTLSQILLQFSYFSIVHAYSSSCSKSHYCSSFLVKKKKKLMLSLSVLESLLLAQDVYTLILACN